MVGQSYPTRTLREKALPNTQGFFSFQANLWDYVELKMKKLFVTLSAVPLSLARPYLKNFKRHYPEIFNRMGSGKKKDRIYVPVSTGNVERPVSNPPDSIKSYLAERGFEVENYELGLARDGKGRTIRMGKILKDENLLKQFSNDPSRSAVKSASNGFVVFSRHPYDLVGMSFNRGWNSCMNAQTGMYKEYIQFDIKHGSLVAYLVKNDDKNINEPIGRVLLKPYLHDVTGDVFLRPGKTYGAPSAKFRDAVAKFCRKFNKGAKEGTYTIHEEVYTDGEIEEIYVGNPSIEDLHKRIFPIAKYAATVSNPEHIELMGREFRQEVFRSICKNENIKFEQIKPFVAYFDATHLMSYVNAVGLSVAKAFELIELMSEHNRQEAVQELEINFGESFEFKKRILAIMKNDFQTYGNSASVVCRLLEGAAIEREFLQVVGCCDFTKISGVKAKLSNEDQNFILAQLKEPENKKFIEGVANCSLLPDKLLLNIGEEFGYKLLLGNKGISVDASKKFIEEVDLNYFGSCHTPSGNVVEAVLESFEMSEKAKTSLKLQLYLVKATTLNKSSHIKDIFAILRDADKPYLALVTVAQRSNPLAAKLIRMIPEYDYQKYKEEYLWNFDKIRGN